MHFTKVTVFSICLLPFTWMVWQAMNQLLGSNPVEELLYQSGGWALRFVLIVLAVSPLRKLTGWTTLLRFRRMLGLFAFFYASSHFLVYFLLDLGMDFSFVIEDIIKRPYITIGFTALVLLIPLALTSTKGMMRRMGRNWKKLHKLVYLIGILGVVHYLWLVKADLLEPLIYAAILLTLFAIRWFDIKIPLVTFKKKSCTGQPGVSVVSDETA